MQLTTVALSAAAATATLVAAAATPAPVTEKAGQIGLIVTGLRKLNDKAEAMIETLRENHVRAVFTIKGKPKKAKELVKAVKKRHSIAVVFPERHEEDIAEMTDAKITKKLKALRKSYKKKAKATVKYVVFPEMEDEALATRIGELAAAQKMTAISSGTSLHHSAKRAKRVLKKLLKKNPREVGLTLRIDASHKKSADVVGQLKKSVKKHTKKAKKHHSKKRRAHFKIVKFSKAVRSGRGSSDSDEKTESSVTAPSVETVREPTSRIVRKGKKYVVRLLKNKKGKSTAPAGEPVDVTVVPQKSRVDEEKPAEAAQKQQDTSSASRASSATALVLAVLAGAALLL